MRFLLQNGKPFFFAGLYDRRQADQGKPLETFTIITTTPNALVRPIHDRMPVILDESGVDEWLHAGEKVLHRVERLLRPCAELMESYAVSTLLNDARVDDARCIEPSERNDSLLPGFATL